MRPFFVILSVILFAACLSQPEGLEPKGIESKETKVPEEE